MPRAEGRARREPLRDIENCLIDSVIVGRSWEQFKCDICDQPFRGDGGQYDAETGLAIDLHEYIQRVDGGGVASGYGAMIADAVRVRAAEDWEYAPGGWRGYACPGCADRINRHWIVMPDA